MVKTLQNTFCHFSVLLKQFSRCEIRLLRYPVQVEDGVVDEGAVEQLADGDGLQPGVEHLAEGEADPERGLELVCFKRWSSGGLLRDCENIAD